MPVTERAWTKVLAPYRKPQRLRSTFELAITAGPFLALCTIAWIGAHTGFWWGLLAIPFAAAFLVRLFMIQHDCGHGAFFGARAADDWTGRVIGIFTLTPYDYWRRDHAIHHANTGDLDRRGTGDILTLTVEEYRNLRPLARLGYRLYRHPAVMFGLGPIWIFFLLQRLPAGQMKLGLRPWVSTMATNLGIALFAVLVIWLTGWRSFVFVYGAIMLLAGAAGIWLFYVQHQFEDTHWSRGTSWNFQAAALKGSSHYHLPAVLRWFTANIGLHHIHHLASKIPFYRLSEVLRDHPELGEVRKLTIRDSLKTVKLALWDDTRQKLISFREARRAYVRSRQLTKNNGVH